MQVHPLTRRGVLSTVSSVFDPLGFAAPLILVGKQILQDLCRENCDWDDPIPDRLKSKWEQWCQELHILEHLKIRRCYKPDDFGETVSAELHHFSNASQSGYGQCTYLRSMDNTKRVHCSLVMGKARVAPLKSVTIPRLELSAAVVSVRSSKWLERELAFPNVVEHFWKDSKVVLGYISNPSRRFHVYVANRIQEIHNRTNSVQWHHVESEENPADAASRGISALQLVQESRWIDGPKFLWDPNFTPVATQPDAQVDPMDPEVRKVSSLATQVEDSYPAHFEMSRLDRFSDWIMAKTAIAICLQFKQCLRDRATTKPDGRSTTVFRKARMDVGDLNFAEMEIIRRLQSVHFQEEIKILSNYKSRSVNPVRKELKQLKVELKMASSLFRLDPYLDEHGIVRVGGRLRNADCRQAIKHPIILPRRSHVTELIVRHCHLAIKHQGRGMTHNELRQRGFWVIGGVSAVSNNISK